MAEEYVPYTGPVVTRAAAIAAGLSRYFTGRPCRRGHISQRRTVNHACTECEWKKRCRDSRNAAERAARNRNPETYKATVGKYLATDKGKATRHAYYVRNAETIKQRAKAHKQANPERALELRQAWYEANKAAVIQRVTDWNGAHPGASCNRGRNYRARVRGAEGFHTVADIEALFTKQGGKCVYCRVSLRKGYHVDHIQPLSKGGSNWPSNLQLLCARCNNNKRATDPVEYARRNGRLL